MAASFDGDFQLPGGSSHRAEDVVAPEGDVCGAGPGTEFGRPIYFLSSRAHPPVGNLPPAPPHVPHLSLTADTPCVRLSGKHFTCVISCGGDMV